MRYPWFFLICSFLCLLFGYTNCASDSNQFGFNEQTETPSQNPPPEDTVEPPPVDSPPESVFELCSETERLETRTFRVRIEERRRRTSNTCVGESCGGCNWGQNGNATIENEKIRARNEQVIELIEIERSTICAMKIQSRDENFRYEDHFFLTLNDLILVAGHDVNLFDSVPSDEDTAETIYEYQWDRLLNQPMLGNVYCLGGTFSRDEIASNDKGCHFPSPGRSGVVPEGKLRLNFPQLAVQSLIDKIPAEDPFVLSFITTGDNDSNDCTNSAFDLEIEVVVVAE